MVCKPGDERHNLESAFAHIDSAADKGADLVCLPELFSTGYNLPHILRHTRPFPDAVARELGQKAARKKIFLMAGIPEKTGAAFYNSAALWDNRGNLLSVYRKNHLMSLPGMGENRLFKRGIPRGEVIKTKLGKIGMMICYDLRFPELARKLAINGAELIVAPSAWADERIEAFKLFSRARAWENQLFVMSVNRAGKDGNIAFGGASRLCGPSGNILAELGKKSGIILAEVDAAEIKAAKSKMDYLSDRHAKYHL